MVTNSINDLRNQLIDKGIEDNISLLPKEQRSVEIKNKLAEIERKFLAELSQDDRLLPFITDMVGLPIESDLNEISELLHNYPDVFIKEDLEPETQYKKSIDQSEMPFKTASNKSLYGGDKLNKVNKCSDKLSKSNGNECNVDEYILERIRSEILKTNLNIGWDDIVGLNDVKKAINEIILWPMQRPDIFTGLRGPPKGLLLFGPPGTGKTMIGKCIASQCNATFFSISASSLTSKWMGEGEKMVRALFYLARESPPSVIFIDEIDSLLSQRSDNENEGSRRIKTEFLVQFDGAGVNSNDRILVIGATNRPHEIDEAARRRFTKRIYVPLPEKENRIKMVFQLMREYANNISEDELQEIGEMTDGYSGSDIFNLCREATLEPLREIEDIANFKANEIREISLADFKTSMKQIRKSVSANDLNGFIEWNNNFGSV